MLASLEKSKCPPLCLKLALQTWWRIIDLSHYYPSLTKCQEKIVHSAIHSHVAPFLTDWQQGFVKSRSCATYQLVLPHHQWTKALEDGLQVDVVFLDFAKAFVKVLHVILLQKLCNFGISEFLLKWCEDYLTERELWVVKRVRVPPGLPFLLLYPRVRYEGRYSS